MESCVKIFITHQPKNSKNSTFVFHFLKILEYNTNFNQAAYNSHILYKKRSYYIKPYHSKACTVWASLWNLHVLSYVVFGGVPCTLLITG